MKGTKMEKPPGIFKTEKGTKIIFAAGIALIIIIFLFSLSGSSKTGGSADDAAVPSKMAKTAEIDEYEQHLEERLAEIIGNIEGTGEVHIMITLERTEENVYSGRETSATITPTVRGALVICQGCENVIIRQKVTDAVCKVLGISAARVCVTY